MNTQIKIPEINAHKTRVSKKNIEGVDKRDELYWKREDEIVLMRQLKTKQKQEIENKN